MAADRRIRSPKSREWLDETFHNRVANGRTKRQTALSIDHAKKGSFW